MDSTADTFRGRFKAIRQAGSDDPLVNPVQKFASETFLDLENGKISTADIHRIICEIELDAFEARAKEFHSRHDPQRSGLGHSLKALDKLDFNAFRQRVEQTCVGAVFTAHPTFALSEEKSDLIAQYPSDASPEKLRRWRTQAESAIATRLSGITLQYEHDHVRRAIARAQDAVRDLNKDILKCARAKFPDSWASLTPNPVSLATWVGYDLDGRTDIHWGQSVRIRLEEKAEQLNRYALALQEILANGNDARLKKVHDRLAGAGALTRQQAERFAGDLNDAEIVVAAANFLTEQKAHRLNSLTPIIEEISGIILSETSEEKALALCLLRAEMEACGLGVARIHLRVNAAQVRSALKADLGLNPDTDFFDRSALDIASRKAQTTELRNINFGSVFLEQMTARRQLMLCAQILKHIDADTPIRFLIAECDAPATVMGAIYLARLYGVDHKLDVSPLFETPQAMERGGRFIERLLVDPEYIDYVKKRGRMTIQIGFSDSGRFIGQCSASLAIERLQVLFAKALGKARLPDVEALIFNTHGESMGRGAHPGSFRERMNHLTTPWVKSRFQKEGVFLNCECSFQGGEGYLHFQNPKISATTIRMLWEQASETPVPDFSDRFYDDINFSWDFYRGLKAWQEALYEREDYRDLLFGFPQHLLYKTGSREAKRPRQGAGPPEIRSMRAIPHNAILQQLAIPSNVSGGVGVASGREVDRFIDHVRASPRMHELMHVAFTARALTSITILRAYAGIYSSSYWSSLAGAARKTNDAEIYESVLQLLVQQDTAGSIDRLANYLAHDLRTTDALSDALAVDDDQAQADGIDVDLGLLHALRQSLMARAVSIVARAPAFSRRHDVGKHDLIDLALHLRLDDVTLLLREIFPKESPAKNLMSGLQETVDDDDIHGGAYPEIHANIIEPVEDIKAAMVAISHAISNHYGAFG